MRREGMNDFKQRLADWRRYKTAHKWQMQTKGVVMDANLGLRSMSWFLLQPVERREKREEEELAVLEKLFEEKHKEIAKNRKRVDA